MSSYNVSRSALRHARALVLAFLAAAMPLVAAAVPAHYLVVREDAAGGFHVLHHAVVEVAEVPVLAATAQWDGDGTRLEKRISVDVERGGQVVFRTDVSASRWLRGEFVHGGAKPVHLEATERHYVVRLPVTGPGARARVGRASERPRSSGPFDARTAAAPPARLVVDLDAVPLRPKAGGEEVFPLAVTGAAGNRLDLLVIGDGYTAEQRTKFQQDAATAVSGFFAISPYSEYRSYVNVRGLFTASAQSGADKPSCPETPSAPVVMVDTAFDATYCSSGLRRLITVDASKVFAAAAAFPDWDEIMVLVNDPEYGGSGGGFIVASLHTLAIPVIQHEFGHTFTRLADEYTTPYPGYPACSDAPGAMFACEPNVSDRTSPLKWQGWVTPGTPIPSVTAPADRRAAGAWEGARYMTSGMYRQCHNGLMRDVVAGYFCRVDTEAFIQRLYAGGWGAPSAGIVLIEPGTTSPPSASIAVDTGATVTFEATVLGPDTGVDAIWKVDGVIVREETLATGATARLAHVAAQGKQAILLTVMDPSTDLLQPRVATAAWEVTASTPARSELAAAPSQLAFGGQSMQTRSPAQRVTLTNTGNTAVTPSLAISAGFTLAHDCGALAAGATCRADVAFAPTLEGPVVGTLTISGAPATVTVSLAGTGERSLVTHYYRSVLRRAPDSAGKAYWEAEAARLRALGADVNEAWHARATSFFGSEEYRLFAREDSGFVADLYATFFNREPEAGGRDYWLGLLGQGLPREAVLASFMFSPEFRGFTRVIFGDTSVRAEVDVVMDFYRAFLARLPDDDGFRYWVGRFRSAQCSGAAAVNTEATSISSAFLASGEYGARARSDGQFVADLYNAFMRRGGDLEGVRYWLGQLAGAPGATRESLRGAFAASPEFQARVRAIIDAGCLR
jgi:hypothetical protein